MENQKTFYDRVFSVGPLVLIALLLMAVFAFGSGKNLFTSLLPSGGPPGNISDVYIPQNYQANPGQQGEIEVRVGRRMDRVAGVQFTVNYPVNQLSVFDASVQGLRTSSFLVIKNTKNPGVFQLSMASADGVNLSAGNTVVQLSVEVKSTVPANTVIPLTLSNVSLVDQDGNTIDVVPQSGQITVTGDSSPGQPYIQSVTPDFGLSTEANPVAIKLVNFRGTITSVKVGPTAVTGFSLINNEIRGTIPAGLATGIYNLTVTDAAGGSMQKLGAFTVIDQSDGLTIDEPASFFSPGKVKNDGVFKTTLWIKVDDLHGVEDIQYVDANLENLGGSPTNRLTADKIVDKSQWFYLSDIQVPTTVASSATPYSVTVTATDRLGKVAKGTVAVTVSGDVETNTQPVVRQAYSVPPAVQNDGTNTFGVFAYVTSDDGPNALGSVVVDLSQLGVGTKAMTKDGEAIGNGFWYKVEGLKVATQIQEKTYQATVTASNTTGDTGSLQFPIRVSNNANSPRVMEDSYVGPARVPADGATPFGVYALVEDPDGLDNIDKVSVSFGDLGIAPREMTKAAVQGEGGWYEAKDLKIPTTALKGEHEVIITVTDKQGNAGEGKERFAVVTADEAKNAPKVESDRSYATPVLVANDGSTPVNLYAYVTDPDGADDIVSADIDLRELGLKPVNKMLEDHTEGKGKWFKFTTQVPPIVAPSSDPYKLKVYASDKSGAVGQGTIELRVAPGNPNAVVTPQIEAAVSIATNKIELIFNKELNAQTVFGTGDNFSIRDRNDIKKSLAIQEATLNTRGNIVILTTANQEVNKPYTVQIDTRVKDTQGVSVRANFGDKADFRGFKEDLRNPSVKVLTPTSPRTLEVTFWDAIKPSSVALDGSDFSIFEVNNSRNGLRVNQVHFKDETTLVLTTEPQKYGVNYGVTIRNIASRTGISLGEAGVEMFFKGFTLPLVGDLNYDNKVDFADFTIFANAYRAGRGYGNGNSNSYLDLIPPDTVPAGSNSNDNTNDNTNAN